MRLTWALSGEEVLGLDAVHTVAALKRQLLGRLASRCSRFQLRLLDGGREALEPLASELQLVVMEHLAPSEPRDSAFLDACEAGEVWAVEAQLQALQDPNTLDANGGCGALHLAADGHLAVVSLLLEAMADTELKDLAGRTALHLAAPSLKSPRFFDDFELFSASICLDFEAVCHAFGRFSYSFRPSEAMDGHLEIVRRLLDAGANRDAADFGGCRALHWTGSRMFMPRSSRKSGLRS